MTRRSVCVWCSLLYLRTPALVRGNFNATSDQNLEKVHALTEISLPTYIVIVKH